jgi:O-methyltransferase involved in polyketide biosynthesis
MIIHETARQVRSGVNDFKAPSGVDPFTPSVARMYDYYLGGKDNFASDREAAEKIIEIIPNVREVAWENRKFLVRVVAHLTGQGVRQFLDVGAGLPTQRNVHQVAQELAPESRVVYVDNDPIVLAHARALLAENADVVAVDADMRQPGALLAHPDVRAHLDFSQPVAILLLGVLHFVPDDDEAARIAAGFRSALGPGGYLAISHASMRELSEELEREGQRVISRTSAPGAASRTAAQVAAFFEGLELVEPGLVDIQDWRPETDVLLPKEGAAGAVGGVARHP